MPEPAQDAMTDSCPDATEERDAIFALLTAALVLRDWNPLPPGEGRASRGHSA